MSDRRKKKKKEDPVYRMMKFGVSTLEKAMRRMMKQGIDQSNEVRNYNNAKTKIYNDLIRQYEERYYFDGSQIETEIEKLKQLAREKIEEEILGMVVSGNVDLNVKI